MESSESDFVLDMSSESSCNDSTLDNASASQDTIDPADWDFGNKEDQHDGAGYVKGRKQEDAHARPLVATTTDERRVEMTKAVTDVSQLLVGEMRKLLSTNGQSPSGTRQILLKKLQQLHHDDFKRSAHATAAGEGASSNKDMHVSTLPCDPVAAPTENESFLDESDSFESIQDSDEDERVEKPSPKGPADLHEHQDSGSNQSAPSAEGNVSDSDCPGTKHNDQASESRNQPRSNLCSQPLEASFIISDDDIPEVGISAVLREMDACQSSDEEEDRQQKSRKASSAARSPAMNDFDADDEFLLAEVHVASGPAFSHDGTGECNFDDDFDIEEDALQDAVQSRPPEAHVPTVHSPQVLSAEIISDPYSAEVTSPQTDSSAGYTAQNHPAQIYAHSVTHHSGHITQQVISTTPPSCGRQEHESSGSTQPTPKMLSPSHTNHKHDQPDESQTGALGGDDSFGMSLMESPTLTVRKSTQPAVSTLRKLRQTIHRSGHTTTEFGQHAQGSCSASMQSRSHAPSSMRHFSALLVTRTKPSSNKSSMQEEGPRLNRALFSASSDSSEELQSDQDKEADDNMSQGPAAHEESVSDHKREGFVDIENEGEDGDVDDAIPWADSSSVESDGEWTAVGPKGANGHAQSPSPDEGQGVTFGSNQPPTGKIADNEAFRRHRESLVRQFFTEFNNEVFDGRLPSNLPISWNARLLRTGGLTRWTNVRATHVSNGNDGAAPISAKDVRVCLSSKVLDTAHRCRDVLLHELCHVASVVLDGCVGKCCGPHGRHFKKWGAIASER